MKKILIAVCLGLAAGNIAGQDMKTLFANIPDLYIPQLESAWRKDLADLFLAGKEARLQHTMNGYAHLLNLTDNYLLLRTTERTTIEMKLLPLVNDTYIICMITTLAGPAPDSRVRFYTTDWKPLPSEGILTPVDAGRFIRDDADRESDAFKDAMALLDMDLMQYSLSPSDDRLTVIYTTPLYLSPTERAKVTPILKEEPEVYVWKKGFYEP
ncbi:MAG: DUF3256 family protein [Tannerellaceae bacterium]|jgi:hypothetical protein|nr:DUF3256 family protein [Tannerellaceae bacterium]